MAEVPARPVPSNLEVEQALLGAVLVNNDAFGEVSAFLDPDHFFEPIHRLLFSVVGEIIRSGRVATPATVKSYIPAETAIADGVNLGQYLAHLAANATSIVNAADYGVEVQSLALRRRILAVGEDLADSARNGLVDKPVQALVADAEQELFGITRELSRGSSRQTSTAGLVADEIVQDLLDPKPRKGIVSTQLKEIDRLLGGLQPGNLIVLAGRPGMMKTTLAATIALNVAGQGFAVDFHSKEMPRQQLVARMMADMVFSPDQPLTYDAILKRRLDDRQMVQAREAAKRLKGLPLVIDPQPGLSVAEISVRARRRADAFTKSGRRLALLVIDHLGKVSTNTRSRAENRTQELGEVTNALADLSKELDLTTVLLCQLNREVDKRDNKRPTLIDLRESGRIEEDADVVVALYREAYYLGKTRETDMTKEIRRVERLNAVFNDLEALVLKNRNGPDGVARLWAHPAAAAVRDAIG